jgi:hypothetical protein
MDQMTGDPVAPHKMVSKAAPDPKVDAPTALPVDLKMDLQVAAHLRGHTTAVLWVMVRWVMGRWEDLQWVDLGRACSALRKRDSYESSTLTKTFKSVATKLPKLRSPFEDLISIKMVSLPKKNSPCLRLAPLATE